MSVIDRMVDKITQEYIVNKVLAREIVKIVFEEIEDDLRRDRECEIRGFGKFSLTQREARTGHNPRTGEPIQIAAAVGVRFKPAAALKRQFNAPEQKQAAAADRAGPPTVAQRRASA